VSRFGIDFAWGRPTIPQLRAHGVTFVGRYFSWHEGRGLASSPGKDLSRDELASYRANGIGVVVAWETLADRALSGEAGGHADAMRALEQARAVGWDGPIQFAVDFDAAGAEVEPYFRGAHTAAVERTGCYGGYRVVSYLFDQGHIRHAWQTYAWSGGQWDRRALVRQYSNEHTVAGVDCDYDVEIGTFPSAPKPAPKPSPLAVLTGQEHAALGEVVTLRKAIWLAAEHGRTPNGHPTPKGWGIRNRTARYHLLWSYTKGLG
jgi:hypothetical protein